MGTHNGALVLFVDDGTLELAAEAKRDKKGPCQKEINY
jgi:hypothetical protein